MKTFFISSAPVLDYAKRGIKILGARAFLLPLKKQLAQPTDPVLAF
jgi:hypothetical protein